MKLQVFTILLVPIVFGFRIPEHDSDTKCGYDTCHQIKPDMINVHLVPHTHDDVGWLKTVDQYFYGGKSFIQKAGVEYILDSVIEALRKDPNRRFIYVETAYFWKWWMKQHDFIKHHVKKMVKNGQLEFIGGAWSMNDEACTHYHSIIDQFTWGFRKLNETFGDCGRPKIGWQIDPFGHSREMASIFAQLGFDGLLLGRIDYQDKQFKFSSKTAEFVWKGSQNLNNSDLFTSVMYNTYAPPPGFCFDVLCDDEPIIDDKKSASYNVDMRLKQFFEYIQNQTKAYKTNNLIVTMGGDFTYMDAQMWFRNLDKLIRHANKLQDTGSKFNLLYSTPSCYLKAVHDEGVSKNIQWNTKQDDFFPYASDPNSFWTGYFTSKPTIKRYERLGNNFLQVCKQLYALTDLGPEDWADLNKLREAMGIMQHHDAVTGTEKDHVAHDYARILSIGMDECNFVAATALSKIVTNKLTTDPTPAIPFQSCYLSNISQCTFTEESDQFITTVYNPLSRIITQTVRLPVVGKAYEVKDPSGNPVPVQLIPIHDAILNIPGRISKAKYDLIFIANDLPPLGFKSFYVSKSSGDIVTNPINFDQIKSDAVEVSLNKESGLVDAIKMNGIELKMSQNFYYYRGSVGDNKIYKNRSSGAYIFRPNGTETLEIPTPKYQIYSGNIVSEIHQTFNEWTSQIIRLYSTENLVEFDWIVGPIPIDDINGKEIITKYTINNMKSESTFYTDSNGREMLKRVRDFRPTWKLQLDEPVAGNYYPVTSKILIRDPNMDVEVAVLTDRAQGGASLKDGEIELMIHRNCLHDDAFGVGEALNEKAFDQGLVARGSHFLVLGSYLQKQGIAALERDIAQRKILQAWNFVSPTNGLSYDKYKVQYKMEYSGLKTELPMNVQILTLEPWKAKSILLRFEHILEKDEDPELSKPVTVDFKDLFSPFSIISAEETTLGANQFLTQNKRMSFNSGIKLEDIVNYYESHFKLDENSENMWNKGKKIWERNQFETNFINKSTSEFPITSVNDDNKFKITLTPMQIRTFIIEIEDAFFISF